MNDVWFLGVFSLLQIGVLPGMIVVKLLRVNLRLAERMALTFGLSLLINYLLVAALALVGLYTQAVILGVLVLEIVLLAWMFRGWLSTPLAVISRQVVDACRAAGRTLLGQFLPDNPDDGEHTPVRSLLLLAGAALGLVGIFWVAGLILRNLGGVFSTWDAILSWNRWAVTWASGAIPPDSGYYPQLLPANWSLTYTLMGNVSIQIFARALGPFFLLFTLWLMLDLGVHSRSYGVLLGAFLTWLVIRGYLGEFIADGYADLPAAFLGLLSVLLLLRIHAESPPAERRKLLWISALISAAAALTKQSGVYLLLGFPLLAALLPGWGQGRPGKPPWRDILLPFGAALLAAASFYLVKSIQIAQGLDESNVTWVTQGIFGGAGLAERARLAWSNLGIYRLLFLWLLPSMLVVRSSTRWLILALAAPYTLLWMFFFSYDTRNLALVLPILGLCAGLGVEGLLDWLLRPLRKLDATPFKGYLIVLGGLLLLLATGFWATNGRLADLQVARQKQILSPQLNAKLYDYFENQPLDGKIISQYPVAYLPGFENQQISFWFDNLPDFLNAAGQPDAAYILMPDNAIPEIQQVVESRLATGEYRLVFQDSSYVPVSFLHIERHPVR